MNATITGWVDVTIKDLDFDREDNMKITIEAGHLEFTAKINDVQYLTFPYACQNTLVPPDKIWVYDNTFETLKICFE